MKGRYKKFNFLKIFNNNKTTLFIDVQAITNFSKMFIWSRIFFFGTHQQLIEVVNQYQVLFFSSEKIDNKIENRIKESKVIVINKYEEKGSGTKNLFFICGFENFF